MGTELLFMLALGLLLLGPKHLQRVLGYVARARGEWENAKRSFRTELAAEVEVPDSGSGTDCLSKPQSTDEA